MFELKLVTWLVLYFTRIDLAHFLDLLIRARIPFRTFGVSRFGKALLGEFLGSDRWGARISMGHSRRRVHLL
jgi:hypothetical protein